MKCSISSSNSSASAKVLGGAMRESGNPFRWARMYCCFVASLLNLQGSDSNFASMVFRHLTHWSGSQPSNVGTDIGSSCRRCGSLVCSGMKAGVCTGSLLLEA